MIRGSLGMTCARAADSLLQYRQKPRVWQYNNCAVDKTVVGPFFLTIEQKRTDEKGQLVVWNRTKSKTVGLKADIAASPAELLGQTEVVILNLFDSDAVHSVMSAEGGLLAGDCKGKIIIDTTTNHYHHRHHH